MGEALNVHPANKNIYFRNYGDGGDQCDGLQNINDPPVVEGGEEVPKCMSINSDVLGEFLMVTMHLEVLLPKT